MKYGYDIYIEARQHRKEALYSKPLIVSEYGDWEYFAMNAGFEQERWSDMLPEERFSRQARGSGEVRLLQQATNVQEAHNDNLSTHAFADGYWAMFDYSRGLLPDLELSGASDVFRLPKYAAWFFRSQRDADEGTPFSEPMVFIASEWKPGISRGVRIFSNCEEVELTLDGRSLGRRTPDTNTMSNRLPHPPFSFAASCEKPGTLTATGYIGGKIAARHTVATPGKPAHIRLKLDESGTPPQSGCNDVLFVYATVTDSAGNVVTDYDKPVQFTVSGDAKYVYTATPQAEAGIAPALLRIGQQGGTIHLAASTDGIVSEPLKIPSPTIIPQPMIRLKQLFAFTAALLIAVPAISAVPPIVPRPLSVEQGHGNFTITSATPIAVLTDELHTVAEIFAADIAPLFDGPLSVMDIPARRAISLNLASGLGEEEYTLSVTRRNVAVTGGSPRAVLYGLQSLRQLINGNRIPAVEIRDKPWFAYRGAMLDAARHFFPGCRCQKIY